MQIVAQILFWGSIVIMIYTWLLFPLLLIIISQFKREEIQRAEITPSVSLIITAHNEEEMIEENIENAFALDYPKDKLEIIVASDGSTDRTNELVSKYFDTGVKLYVPEGRRGKSLTQNEAIATAKGEIIVLTDADAMLDKYFVKEIVKNFHDPKVGCATGLYTEAKLYKSAISNSVGVFWKFEMLLRDLESRIGALFTTSGACMAFRKDLFVPMDKRFADDGIIALDIILQGYRVVHDKNARAFIAHPASEVYQFSLRSRVIVRNVPCLLSRSQLLNPFRYPLHALAIVSHRFFRWLTPWFIVILFLSNALLLSASFYQTTSMLQVLFYIFAYVGSIMDKKHIHIPIFSMPYSFCVANAGFLMGFIRLLRGQEISKYHKEQIQ